MRRKKWRVALAALLTPVLLLSGCGGDFLPAQSSSHQEEAPSSEKVEVTTMYLTVSRGNSAENTDHSWAEVNAHPKSWYEEEGIAPYAVEAMLQVGDESGPTPGSYGYESTAPNATVRIRGEKSSRNVQKSYRIQLKSGKGDWNGQQVINLNKHVSDGLRFRNMLAYSILADLPRTYTCSTQFVHLYVKDNTEDDGGDSEFEDYGLYTQVEQVNKEYLGNHGLDRSGHLYKINYFDFAPHEAIRLATDAAYDEQAFSAYLETRGNTDNTKLLNMLEAVNDESISTQDVVHHWFNTDNLIYWFAFNILTGNVDTVNENFLLYSPQNAETFYFIPWDNDGILKRTEDEMVKGKNELASWQDGVSNYWSNVLLRRLLQDEHYRQELTAAIEDLRTDYLAEDRIRERAEEYSAVIKPYIYSEPDVIYERLTASEYDTAINSLFGEIGENYRRYQDSLEVPMPFTLHSPAPQGGQLSVSWDPSLDLAGEGVTYTFELARDYTYSAPIVRQDKMTETHISLAALPAGQYFIRVIAADASGHEQIAYNRYGIDGGTIDGTMCFYVLADGSVVEDAYTE